MKKPVKEVEGAEFQYALIGSFPDELQEISLTEAVQSINDTSSLDELNELVQAWYFGDEKALIDADTPDESDFSN